MSNTSFPKELEDIATSIRAETGKNVNRSQLVAEILNRLEVRLGDICTKEFLDDYRKRSIIIGKRISSPETTFPRLFSALTSTILASLLFAGTTARKWLFPPPLSLFSTDILIAYRR